MSIRWMDHIWHHGPENRTEKLILLALADWANDEGIAYPSLPVLAKKSCVPEKTLRRYRDKMIRDGWISRERVGNGRGNRSVYQLHHADKRVPSFDHLTEKIKVVNSDHLSGAKGGQIDREKVVKSTEPFNVFKPSVKNLKPSSVPVNTLPRDTAAKGAPPTAAPVEARNLADLIVCASPWGVLRSIHAADVTPEHRIFVLQAAEHEARASGISKIAALEGLLRVVESQVATLPRDELRFLGDLKSYFSKRNYRIETKNVMGGSKNGKGRSIENTLREFLGRGGDSESFGDDGDSAFGRPRSLGSGSLQRRLG